MIEFNTYYSKSLVTRFTGPGTNSILIKDGFIVAKGRIGLGDYLGDTSIPIFVQMKFGVSLAVGKTFKS